MTIILFTFRGIIDGAEEDGFAGLELRED